MITIINRQRKIAVNEKKISTDAQKILEIIHYPDFDLGILLANPQTIREYNKTYRLKDKVTDILSFAHHPEHEAGKRIKVKTADDKNLGDLIICPEYVVKEAEKHKVSFDERMRVLLVHGVCHLLGYDHEDDHDWRRMRAKEAYILKQLNQS